MEGRTTTLVWDYLFIYVLEEEKSSAKSCIMKQLLIACLIIISLSSCLKQSIADAMLDKQYSGGGIHPKVATMTYTVNGNTVTTSVNYPDRQPSTGYELGCSKTFDPFTNFPVYSVDCISTSGEMTFMIFSDSLAVGNYNCTSVYGDMFVLDYNNADAFLHAPTDNISINITSYTNGHISGTFSGKLTPMVSAGYPTNTYGTPGSVIITKGSFKDVPVFY